MFSPNAVVIQLQMQYMIEHFSSLINSLGCTGLSDNWLHQQNHRGQPITLQKGEVMLLNFNCREVQWHALWR